MSHIVSENEDLNFLHNYLELIRSRGYNYDNLHEILNGIIPVNDKFNVDIKIDNEGYTAYFSGFNRFIHLNQEDLLKYVNSMVDEVIKMYPSLLKSRHELFSYIVLFVLCHEVEHVYQFMFGHDYLKHDYKIVRDLYKNMTEFSTSENTPPLIRKILLERYKYVKDRATFVLERNANVEAYELLHRLSLFEGNEDIIRFISNQCLWYSACGYLKFKNNGSFEESFRNTWRHKMFKSFDFSEDISVEERIRYGLPLDDENRIILLKKFIDTRENKH